MRRGVLTALALLMIVNVVSGVISLIIAGAIILGSIGFGAWLGHELWVKPADKKIHELEQQLTNETLDNLATLESAAVNEWDKSKVIVYDLGDAIHYGRNYAWALAKYNIIKALEQGDSLDAAASKARMAVYKYYLNVTKNIIEEINTTSKYLNYTLNEHYKEAKDVSGTIDRLYLKVICDIKWCRVGYNYKSQTINDYIVWHEPPIKIVTAKVTILGQKFNVLKLEPNAKLYGMISQNVFGFSIGNRDIKADVDTIVYDWNVYNKVLNQINNEYNNIINNIDAYVQGLKNKTFNTTDLIDPYVLATFLNKDWNKTGYYGYAAAELALLGLPTTGLNKTVTISYDGKTMSGFLFTDWTGKIEVNKSYTADGNHVWYFVTTDDQGHTLLVPLKGQFKVTGLQDWQGHKLNNTTLVNYDPHSGDIQKIYEELEKIETLYEQYLNNLQPAASGGGLTADIYNWWNSLDETAKIGVIVVGCVAVYAILRRR